MYRKKHILIIDDWDMSAVKFMLERFGYQVLLAKDGPTALTLLDDLTYEFRLPDLILVDTMMPDMDGLEVIRRIKANFETRHIPIVLWHSDCVVDWIVQALELGCVGFQHKWINPHEFNNYLQKLFKEI